MKTFYKILIPILLFLSQTQTFAQKSYVEFEFEPETTYIFTLNDESKLVGKYISKDLANVSISTTSIPKIDIPFSEIKKIEKVAEDDIKDNQYWFPNPNATRYLFAPSAFALKKGKGYYQNSYLFFNSFNYGLSDNVTIGGGFEFITTFIVQKPVFYITPKIAFPVAEKVNLGAGLLYLSTPKIFTKNSRSNFGIAYGIGTYGTPNHNITAGLGWGFVENEMNSKPIVTISGITRISRRLAFVSENWIIPTKSFDNEVSYKGYYSYGIRFFGEKMAIDFAMINNKQLSKNFSLGFPYIDFVVNF